MPLFITHNSSILKEWLYLLYFRSTVLLEINCAFYTILNPTYILIMLSLGTPSHTFALILLIFFATSLMNVW